MSVKNVLIVEDDFLFRDSLRLALAAYGCEVACASGIEEAVVQNRALCPDLALVDIMIGLGPIPRAFVEQLCAENPRLKIVLMTGYPGGAEALARNYPAVATILRKPFGTASLVQLLGRAGS